MHSNKHIKGLTLIELLVAISIAAIILGVGLPSYSQFIASNSLRSTRDLLVSSIMTAQQHAMKRNIAVYLCPTSTETSCASSWVSSTGWLVYEDADRSDGFTTGDLIVAKELNIKIEKITTTNVQTRFSSTGNVAENVFTLCNNITSEDDNRISINRSGRITYEAAGAHCP